MDKILSQRADDDNISRQAAIDAISTMFAPTPTQKDMVEDCLEIIDNLPSTQPEYTEHEKTIMTMLFGIVKTMLDVQGGYMDIDGESFSRNDLFDLSEKLGIEDY